jgi:hypothetical protein
LQLRIGPPVSRNDPGAGAPVPENDPDEPATAPVESNTSIDSDKNKEDSAKEKKRRGRKHVSSGKCNSGNSRVFTKLKTQDKLRRSIRIPKGYFMDELPTDLDGAGDGKNGQTRTESSNNRRSE